MMNRFWPWFMAGMGVVGGGFGFFKTRDAPTVRRAPRRWGW
jgi:hypothetical protein